MAAPYVSSHTGAVIDQGITDIIAILASGVADTITAQKLLATATVAAADGAAMGYTAANGLELTGQGSTNDITLLNDAKATIARVLTGTTNLTLAGGLHIGGAVAANLLDDIEVNTFQVTATASTGTITVDTGQDDLTYLKLGRFVFIFGKISISGISNPAGAFRLSGLPFTVSNDVGNASTAAARITGFHADLGTSSVNVDPEVNTTTALLTYNVVGTQGNIGGWVQASGTVTLGFGYHTDS